MQFAKMAMAFHNLFDPLAKEVMDTYKVIWRERKFNPVSLIATFVLGLLSNPRATDQDLVGIAARGGLSVTRQAIRNRMSEPFENALKELFGKAVKIVVVGGHAFHEKSKGSGLLDLQYGGCYAVLMPRAPRADEAGGLYHTLNRGNLRAAVFRKEADYDAFERIPQQQ